MPKRLEQIELVGSATAAQQRDTVKGVIDTVEEAEEAPLGGNRLQWRRGVEQLLVRLVAQPKNGGSQAQICHHEQTGQKGQGHVFSRVKVSASNHASPDYGSWRGWQLRRDIEQDRAARNHQPHH